MKVLVTGGAGYVGSVLVPKLLVRGHQVRVVDIGYFGLGHLRGLQPAPEVIREDLRSVINDPEACARLMEGCDCIIHLAAMSNDPSAELQPKLTEECNFDTTVALARVARDRNIRFLFSSSCSVYGEADNELDENGATAPLTVYAKSKVNSEEALERLAEPSWRPVILRNGTLFGYSQRMRFDLVINIFSLYSTIYNEIRIFGEGNQWRPFLHVGDCARAFVYFAENEARHILYNVAHQNLRVQDLAAIFQKLKPGLKVTHVPTADIDSRDYSVSTARLRAEQFKTYVDVAPGAEEIMEAIVCGIIRDPESLFYRNAKWLKELTQIGGFDHRHIVDLIDNFNAIKRTNA